MNQNHEYDSNLNDVANAILADNRELAREQINIALPETNHRVDAWLMEAWTCDSLQEAEVSMRQALKIDPCNRTAVAGLTWIHGINEMARNQIEAKQHAEVQQRLAEEPARLAEVQAREAEETRLAEEARLEEEARLAEEARLEEETRIEAEQKQHELEARREEERLEAVRLVEEVRLAEAQRLEEQAAKAEEAASKEETVGKEEAASEEETVGKEEAFGNELEPDAGEIKSEQDEEDNARLAAEEEMDRLAKKLELLAEDVQKVDSVENNAGEDCFDLCDPPVEINAQVESGDNDECLEFFCHDIVADDKEVFIVEELSAELETVDLVDFETPVELGAQHETGLSTEAAHQLANETTPVASNDNDELFETEVKENVETLAEEIRSELEAKFSESTETTTPSSVNDAEPDPRPIVLCVDDSPAVRKLVSLTLRREGYEVITAEDGLEAVNILAETLPDLILTDINMPKRNGYQLCAHIKKHERTSSIPVVMLSGKNMFDKLRGKMNGCDDFISKPFESADLIAKVKEYLTFVLG